MTSYKLSHKRIGQALGLLVLGLALLADSRGYGQTHDQIAWPWGLPFASIQLPPDSDPKELSAAPATLTVRSGFLAIAYEGSDSLGWQLIAGPTHSSPGQPGHNGGIQAGIDPHSVEVAEVTLAASAGQPGSQNGKAPQLRTSQAQQKVLRAFVGNFGSGDVSVVDIQFEGETFENQKAKLSVVETIKVGRQPTSLDFDPNSNKLYVNNFGDNNVSVIEVKAAGGSQVIATITGFRQPIFVRISPDGKRGYVSSQRTGEGVAVFDTATASITGRIDLPNVELRRLALSPDGKRLYAAVRTDILGTGQIAVIDTESLQVLQRYRTESFPLEIVVTPNGRCLFITHSVPNRVSFMDVSNGQFAVTQDPTAKEPQSVAIIENRAYVTNRLSDTISVFEFGEPCI